MHTLVKNMGHIFKQGHPCYHYFSFGNVGFKYDYIM